MPATATKTTKKKVHKKKRRPRSPNLRTSQAILATLNRKSWMSREDLIRAVGNTVPAEYAERIYDERIGQDDPHRVKVMRGRAMVVMLACITLNQYEKIVQRGRGDTKAYKLA